MKNDFTCGFIGLGLIGGSIARALRKFYPECCLLAYDINRQAIDAAMKDGVINVPLFSINEELRDCDYIFLCAPVAENDNNLSELKKYLSKDCLLTDVGSVKTDIHKNIEKAGLSSQFIGGHPMAGKERSGFKNSDENLFNRASYILTPTDNTDPKALDIAKQYVEALHCAKLTVTDPKTHDRMIAFTSQLPHIIAGAYVKSPSVNDRKGFSAGSFKDVSRVATVDENLWTELFLKNSEMLLSEIDGLIEHLADYRNSIAQNDAVHLKEIIKQGRIIKENDLKESDERK